MLFTVGSLNFNPAPGPVDPASYGTFPMESRTPFRLLFLVSAAYDGLLGFAFLVAGSRIFSAAGITPPNHWGYVDFAASLLLLFGVMFLQIARDPAKNRLLIPYGILLKICYIGTVLWHAFTDGVPTLWKFFAAADTLFLLLYLAALSKLKKST